ncbi:MAG: hypothetical protein K0S80_4074, partial [Neobacillus sp.]|nr:hypothetical protein [Neobacillus sp.]
MINENIYFHNVDWNGRHADSCGRSETGETPQTRSVEEARRSPAESEVPGVPINILMNSICTYE